MASINTIGWGAVEEYCSTLFLVAGVLMLVAISIGVLRNTTGFSSPSWVHNFLGPLGVVCTAYGLLAFYPWVAEASPRLARAGLVLATVAAAAISVAFLVATGAAVLTDATVTNPPDLVPPLYFTTIAALALGFLVYGVASLRTRVPSRAIGLTMLAPAVLLSALFVGENVFGLHVQLPRIVFVGTPVFLLFLGYTVRDGTTATDREKSAVKSPA